MEQLDAERWVRRARVRAATREARVELGRLELANTTQQREAHAKRLRELLAEVEASLEEEPRPVRLSVVR